jgi:hypothetical protein
LTRFISLTNHFKPDCSFARLKTCFIRYSLANVCGVSATPTLSANSLNDGVVWLLRSKVWNAPDQPAALYAYDASNVAHELYNSEQNAARDRPGLALRFNIPMVVNGHVYVGSKHEVDVYGLLPVR